MKIEMTKQMREEGWVTVNGHLRKPLATRVEGMFCLHLAMAPPTVTHHDKEIGRRFKAGGGTVPTLRNSPALNAAWTLYLSKIPERRFLVPLAPPVKLWVTFRFPWPREGEPPGHDHVFKPDLDNSVKVLKDVLAMRGFLAADEHVSREDLAKEWAVTHGGEEIVITARSLNPLGDSGCWEPIDAPDGVVVPVPWKLRQHRDSGRRVRLARQARKA